MSGRGRERSGDQLAGQWQRGSACLGSDYLRPDSAVLADPIRFRRWTLDPAPVEAALVPVDGGGGSGYAYWVSGLQSAAKPDVPANPGVLLSALNPLQSGYDLSAVDAALTLVSGLPGAAARLAGLEQYPLLLDGSADAQAAFERLRFDLGLGAQGLLTNARSGGLKRELSSFLETMPTAQLEETILELPTAVEADRFASKGPTWGRLKSFYDLRNEFIANGSVEPRPGTATEHPISPVMAMFSFGASFGLKPVGVDGEQPIEYLLHPQLVLHNPYNVPLAAREYGLILFPTSVTNDEVGRGGSSVDRNEFYPIIRAGFNAEYSSLGYRPFAGFISSNFIWQNDPATPSIVDGLYADAWEGGNYELSRRRHHPDDRDDRGSVFQPTYSPGPPRFVVEVPEMAPGEALVFTPDSVRMEFFRMEPYTGRMTPGLRDTSFEYGNVISLVPATHPDLDAPPASPDSVQLTRSGSNTSIPRFIDAALTTLDTVNDRYGEPANPLFTQPGDGRRPSAYYSDAPEFMERVFHYSGRVAIDYQEFTTSGVNTTLTYGSQISGPAAGILHWAAYAYGGMDQRDDGRALNQYQYFNPRAKINESLALNSRQDPSNSEITNFSQNYFYEPFMGLTLPPLQTSGPDNRSVAIAGGLFNPQGQRMILYDIPRDPVGLYSLGQLQHLQASDFADEPAYAIGNSLASPHIPRDQIYSAGLGVLSQPSLTTPEQWGRVDRSVLDLSYLLNEALWDGYFLSTLGDFVQADLDNERPLPNFHLRYRDNTLIEDLREPESAAAELVVSGAFNVNSTSEAAWKSFLAGNDGRLLNGSPLENPFFRLFENRSNPPGNPWVGLSEVEDARLDAFAEAIVRQVKERGPFRSMADFVNRRLIAEADDSLGHGLHGALQAAIEEADLNAVGIGNAAPGVAASALEVDLDNLEFAEPEHMAGTTIAGIPGLITQADLLTALGPLMTARDDTFVIRATGVSEGLAGNGRVEAHCEVTVQRIYEYVDPIDAVTLTPGELSSQVNRDFGRRYEIVAFRWLSPEG